MSTESKGVKRKFQNIDGPVEAPHRTNHLAPRLCTRCVELRLEEALTDIKPPVEGSKRLRVKIADIGQYYRDQWADDCNLCHILSASRVIAERPQNPDGGDELYVFDLYDHLSWVQFGTRGREFLRGDSFLYLAVVPSGFNASYNVLSAHGEKNGFTTIHRRDTPKPQIYAPQIVSPFFDLSLARYWLQYCKGHHKRLCSLQNRATTELHLIDCRSLEVIPAPDQAVYTALSYVWGAPTTTTDSTESAILSWSYGRRLPSSMPAIIADAITVTKGLGFHFLWVDRYCIDQDSHSKHQQINQMDKIYQNAEMTIVAAAGNGPEYGLPGINCRPRCGQQTCTVGDFDIISTMRHPHTTIQSSKWSSRGWTFQEAALSRRNLVFTDDQVYFECNAMNCHESLRSNLERLHIKNKSKFRAVLQAGLFGGTEKQKYGNFDVTALRPAHNLIRFMGMVEQYTVRDLTYDKDSLNAFTGIIRKFETAETPMSQIWGVPFYRGETKKETNDSFLDGLGWIHKRTTICEDSGYPRCRPEFPSWSWAGWAGAIEYEDRSDDGIPRQLDSEVESISIETGGGWQVSLSAYIDEAKIAPQEIVCPSAIHIRALALPPSAFSYGTSTTSSCLQVFGYPARLALSTGPWDVSIFFQSVQNANHRRCIYLGYFLRRVVLMVLEALDDSWSRVGMIVLDSVWRWDFCKSWKEFTTRSRVKGRSIFRAGDIGEEATSFRVI